MRSLMAGDCWAACEAALFEPLLGFFLLLTGPSAFGPWPGDLKSPAKGWIGFRFDRAITKKLRKPTRCLLKI